MYKAIASLGLAVALVAPVAGAEQAGLARLDTAEMQTMTLAPAAWTYSPTTAAIKVVDGPIKLPHDGRDGGVNGGDFLGVVPGGFGVAALEFKDPMQPKQRAVGVVDMTTGVARAPISLPPDMAPLAVTADGSRAAVSGDGTSQASGQVQIVKLAGDDAEVEFAFMPFEGESDKGRRTVPWARFADNAHLLTLNEFDVQHGTRRLVAWQLGPDAAKGLWSLTYPAQMFVDPVVTADGRHVVIINRDGIYLVESLSGKVVGTIDDPAVRSWFGSSGLRLAVSRNGRTLACVTHARVKVYSLVDRGKRVADVFMPPGVKIDNAFWTSDDELLINQQYLADVSKGMIVWRYGGLGGGLGDHTTVFAAGDHVAVVSPAPFPERKLTLRTLVIPGPDVKRALASLNMDKVMAVRPGMKVSLDVDIPDEQVATAVRTHFEQELKKNDMTVADGQPVVLRVKIADSNTRDVQYHDARRPISGRTSKATVDNKQMTVAYEVDGKRVWDVVLYSSAPLMVHLEGGQTLDSAIKKRQANDWKQLESVELPRYVPALRDPPGFGQTALDVEHKP